VFISLDFTNSLHNIRFFANESRVRISGIGSSESEHYIIGKIQIVVHTKHIIIYSITHLAVVKATDSEEKIRCVPLPFVQKQVSLNDALLLGSNCNGIYSWCF